MVLPSCFCPAQACLACWASLIGFADTTLRSVPGMSFMCLSTQQSCLSAHCRPPGYMRAQIRFWGGSVHAGADEARGWMCFNFVLLSFAFPFLLLPHVERQKEGYGIGRFIGQA